VARYKVLKGVAHSFGHSFTSLMNYRGHDYVMGLLVVRSWETGVGELTVDVLSGDASPAVLLSEPIRAAVRAYCDWFPALLTAHGTASEFVRRVAMNIRFDLSRAGREPRTGLVHAPYVCRVVIEDSRGRPWIAELRGTWHSELPSRPTSPSRWHAFRLGMARMIDRLRGRIHPAPSAMAKA
jgi:hypothetical protein